MNPEQVQTLAAYNQWMNDKLYDCCARLSDAERKQDRGAFFKSIHGTLNHLLLADHVWMSRFSAQPFQASSLDAELFADFTELRDARQAMDREIIRWAGGVDQPTLDGVLEYTSMVNPAPRKSDMWLAVSHLFNHQTHHRGQITTLLCQCGVDVGVTDLMWLPEVQKHS